MSRELLKRAADKLRNLYAPPNLVIEIDEYLKMPEPEPVAWIEVGHPMDGPYNCHFMAILPKGRHHVYTAQPNQSARIELLEQRLKAVHAEIEPVAWMIIDKDFNCMGFLPFKEKDTIPVYTTPPDQSARIAELERSESFLKDAIEAAIRDTKYYRDESESRLEGLMSATEANRRLIDKITSLEQQVSPGNDMQLALHEGDKRNPQLAALQAKRDPLSDDEIRDCAESENLPYFENKEEFDAFSRAIEKAHGIGVK